jgi:hypothetical protein
MSDIKKNKLIIENSDDESSISSELSLIKANNTNSTNDVELPSLKKDTNSSRKSTRKSSKKSTRKSSSKSNSTSTSKSSSNFSSIIPSKDFFEVEMSFCLVLPAFSSAV